jgi:hypothetical protein
MMEARPCVAGLRRNTRSDCRRAATQGAPSNIAALPHLQIATLFPYRSSELTLLVRKNDTETSSFPNF